MRLHSRARRVVHCVSTASEPLSPLERLLCVVTEVRRGEGSAALTLLAQIFLVLCAYYFIKPVREGWLAVSPVGDLAKIELKAYTNFLQALVLMGLVPLYSRLASRWSRGALIGRVGLFFLFGLPLFWLLQPGLLPVPMAYAGLVYYVWTGIFALTLVAQFWSFAADLYGEERGARLFPLVAVGAAAGAVVGSWLSQHMVADWGVETFDQLLLAMIPLGLALVLARRVDRRGVDAKGPDTERHEQPAAPHTAGAYRLILNHHYLRLTALMILAMFWVLTNGENILFAVVQRALETEGAGLDALKTETSAFYGRLYFWVNLSSLLLQSFVVSRLLRWGGFRALMLTPPLVSMLTYGTMLAAGSLGVVTAAKTAENGTSYSITNTARHMLWLPTTREMMYKAKAAVDTLCVRFGDGLAALTVLVGARFLGLQLQAFMVFNLALIAAWLVLAVLVVKEHRRLATGSAPQPE